MLPILLLAHAASSQPDVPGVSGAVVVSDFMGACYNGALDTPASIELQWNVAQANNTLYETQIRENGVLVATVPSTTTSWLKEVTGYVQNGSYHQFTSNWTYKVDMVRKSDGVAVGSTTASTWAQLYGKCSEFGT